MKKIFTICLCLLLAACSKEQFYTHLIGHGFQSNPVSNVKNIREIPNQTGYRAFGTLLNTRTNRMTFYGRAATNHLEGGVDYYQEYNIAADHWYDTVTINIPGFTKDKRDIWGIKMDNDSIVLFAAQSDNNLNGGDWSIDMKVLKLDTNNVIGTAKDFDWSGIPVRLQRDWVFNNVIAGDSPGEYYATLIQSNVDTGVGHNRISVIKTSNYWNNYSEVGIVYDDNSSPIGFSETALIKWGGGKWTALMRNNMAGSLSGYESSNNCVTWTPRVSSSNHLPWYIGGKPMIPNSFQHQDGTVSIFYECRDNNFMLLSKGNNVIDNFGTSVYKDPELWAWNSGGGGNPSLGYGAMEQIPNSNIYVLIYAYEIDNSNSRLMYSRTDLTTDPDGIPIAPPSIDTTVTLPTTTTFRIDIEGYTQKQLDNVRYWVQDVSTSPTFSTFSTLKYFAAATAQPTFLMHDIRTFGLFTIYSSATTGTRYWVRVKACNNAGCSAYTTVSAITQ